VYWEIAHQKFSILAKKTLRPLDTGPGIICRNFSKPSSWESGNISPALHV